MGRDTLQRSEEPGVLTAARSRTSEVVDSPTDAVHAAAAGVVPATKAVAWPRLQETAPAGDPKSWGAKPPLFADTEPAAPCCPRSCCWRGSSRRIIRTAACASPEPCAPSPGCLGGALLPQSCALQYGGAAPTSRITLPFVSGCVVVTSRSNWASKHAGPRPRLPPPMRSPTPSDTGCRGASMTLLLTVRSCREALYQSGRQSRSSCQ